MTQLAPSLPRNTALYPVKEIRVIEQAALRTLPPGTLMQRAGEAAARLALKLVSNKDAPVLVLAGPGNNGGDALETAFHLANAGLPVTVMLYADPERQPMDSRQALERARSTSAHILPMPGADVVSGSHWALVIDGLFGIGLARAIPGDIRTIVDAVNTLTCPLLALDVPSGLDADTGNIVGDGGTAIRATHTITFIADKPGLHTAHGRDYAGVVEVEDLEIETSHFPSPHARLNSLEAFADYLQHRPHNTHKGSFGDVIVIGGAHGMGGAPILTARAAAKCGAGRVFAAFLGTPPVYDSLQPELMCRSALEMDFNGATLVAGPGMGTSTEARHTLKKVLAASSPLVLDADALNIIADDDVLKNQLASRSTPTLITPHPLEAARLLKATAREVQSNRLEAADTLARALNATVVLKGSGSVIAHAEEGLLINTTGNPALATAGTGDVLAGICGALIAQSFPVWNAASAAVWLHGQAADTLASQGSGPIGLCASELIPAVRVILNQLTQQYAPRRVLRN